MTDDVLMAIRDGIRAEMAAHMAGILSHMSAIRDDIDNIKRELHDMRMHGCSVGSANKASVDHLARRLDSLDARAAAAGGIVGAVSAVVVSVIDWLTKRQ